MLLTGSKNWKSQCKFFCNRFSNYTLNHTISVHVKIMCLAGSVHKSKLMPSKTDL